MKKHTNPLLRSGAFVLVAALVSLASLACGPTPESDDRATLVVSNVLTEKIVRNFNPLSGSRETLWPSIGGVYESLMLFNVFEDKFTPWLAAEYQWDVTDQLLTFTLQENVKWSDGNSFSARDVAFTFEYLKQHPALDHDHVWQFLKEVRVEDDTHVIFVFKHSFVPGMEYLVHQPIVPEHIWRTVDEPVGFANENPITTGPFSEVLHFGETYYELGRNPGYWQVGKPEVEVLRLPLFRSNDEAFAALLAGEIDWSGNFIPDMKAFLKGDPEHRGYWFPSIDGPVFLFSNATRTPFGDARVRRAMSMAFDRAAAVEEVFGDMARVADATALDDGMASDLNKEAVAMGTWVNFDPQQAEAILDEAGFVKGDDGLRRLNGEAKPYEILIPAGWSDWIQIAEHIEEGLSAIGIQVVATPTIMTEYWNRVRTGDFDLAMGASESRSTVYTLYRSLLSSATVRPLGETSVYNWHRFADEQADALLMAYEMTREKSVQAELLRRLQVRFVEIAPAIPIFLGPSWGTYNEKRFTGFPTAENPYAPLAPYNTPECILVLTNIKVRGE